MKKIETIWHHVLHEALLQRRYRHTQQELAQAYRYSLSTIHHALAVPAQIGAIRKESKFFVLESFQKLLYYWASLRKLKRDVIYQTSVDQPVLTLEGFAIPSSIFACYSAARLHLKEPPADYAKVYFYVAEQDLGILKERFPPNPDKKKQANVVILRMPPTLVRYGSCATLVQTFVDIWGLSDWYARDFTLALEEKIKGCLGEF